MDSDQGCQKFLPRALPAAASTEFYSGIITASWTRFWLVLRMYFSSLIFSQVLEASGDDTAGEPQKEPWKPGANSLLLLPLGMVRPQVDLCPQGAAASGTAWEVLGWMSWGLVPYCCTPTCGFVQAASPQ